MNDLNLKKCSKCGYEKLYSEFHKDKTHKDGHRNHCKICEKEINLNYRIKNRKKLIDEKKVYRSTHKEQERDYKKEYRAANRKMIYEQEKLYRAKNHDRYLERKAEYHRRKPEKQQERSQRRRARKHGAYGTHTLIDIKQLYLLQRNKCAICKTSISDGYHVDHIISLSKGGSNDKYNLQLLCPSCNMKKHTKDPIQFMQLIGMLL